MIHRFLHVLPLASFCAVAAHAQSGLPPTVTARIATGGIFAGGVAFDPVTDDYWVTDGFSTVVGRFDVNGVPNSAYLAPVPSSVAVATPVGADLDTLTGNLWMVDQSGDVFELDRTGAVLRTWSVRPILVDASAIAIDPVFRILFVSDDTSNLIQQFAMDGTPLGAPIDVGLTAGSVDGDGLVCNWLTRRLLIGEDAGDRILEVDIHGTLHATYSLVGIPDLTTGGTVTVSPEGLALDTATGELLVSASEGSIVYRIANIVPPPIGAVTRFGSGCADSGGMVPQLGMNGLIAENNSYDFVVQTSVAPGSGAMAYFVIGVAPVTVDLGFLGAHSCTLLALPDIGVHGPLPIGAHGRAGQSLGLGVGLGGLTLRWQAVVFPDGPNQLALSHGLITTIQ